MVYALLEVHAIDIKVDYLVDNVGIAANFAPEAGHCNIRSAWELCSQMTEVPCNIVLTADSSHAMNTTDRPLGAAGRQHDSFSWKRCSNHQWRQQS